MQVSVTNSDGLKRTLRVVIDQGELDQRFTTRLDEVKNNIQLKGFRRGKVPRDGAALIAVLGDPMLGMTFAERYVVEELIGKDNELFGTKSRRFFRMDIIEDSLPQTDLIFCRDCLVHLSHGQAIRVLRNFKRSGARLFDPFKV